MSAARGSRRAARLLGLGLGALSALVTLTVASAARADEEPDPLRRARAREALLAERSAAAEQAARAQALLAYRVERQQTLGFLDAPGRRADAARALDALLLVLRRSLEEAALWRRELALASGERRELESALAAGAPEDPGALGVVRRLFRPPARGSAVAWPGVRRDPVTSAETRLDGVQILARMNEPVRAVAGGEVRAVTALPQGGFAVVMVHPDGWVSVLSGLREIDAAPGERLEKGSLIGRVGRSLDGAPVLTFELWHHGVAVDTRGALGRAVRGRAL
jgi:murein DD-endopeptidase MepM/ murein hydrolase activator NlpD